ncbi:ParB/RepB/Spo0J family partition protein [Paraburkholderia humisilvae]|uniref:Nucleoid occlusion protein n=1 Tax=Paraburkholderia humisilvae TaxID=627669 RepID=A0A6J5EQB0_9BURK|nr:ParB/RepB/Spo0J family partition protein [Paraburkholderia humisilvae]CAB3767402.1 Nucleoid occlusion protein [Paraburkholderia humisilvae]
MNDKPQSQNTNRGRLAKSLRRGLAMERGDVDGRLDAQGIQPNAASSTDAGASTSPAVATYGGRGNSSAVKPRLTLPLSELVSNPFNPRTFYSPEAIDGLAVKLKRDGQYETIKVTENARFPGKYVIVDGEYRFRAKKSLGEEFIEAEVLPVLSDRDLYLIANRINKDRTAQSVFDDAVGWKKVLDEGVFPDQDSLAASLDISKSLLSKILKLNALPETLLRRMAESHTQIGITNAYNITLMFERRGLETAETYLEQVINGEISSKRLQEINAKADNDSSPRQTRSHYSARVQFSARNGAEIGELKRFRDGRTQLKLEGLTEQQQETLSERLEALVREFVESSVNPGLPSEQSGS